MVNKTLYLNKSDKKILIYIFYGDYIKDEEFQNDLFKNHGKKLGDFTNNNKLYLFLKKHGYVDNFYKIIAPKIIKNYSKFMNKILTHPGIDEFKKNTQKKIKKFSSINLLKLVDKYVSDRLNKIYIKNKFTEIIKKYNI